MDLDDINARNLLSNGAIDYGGVWGMISDQSST